MESQLKGQHGEADRWLRTGAFQPVEHLGFPAEASTIWSCVKRWNMLEARNPMLFIMVSIIFPMDGATNSGGFFPMLRPTQVLAYAYKYLGKL
jgi:hypothetical protein